MNNYSDLKYFTEFQQKSCTEIIEKYNKNQAEISGSSIDEIIFNYFMPTYSCILRNDVDNAKTWKDNMEYALKGKDISLSQNSQYDIVTNFLDAHISRLKFEFYEALNHISAGYNEAKNTNNIHFCIRFMFLRGWLYSYLGHSELAEAEFLEAEKVIKENHIDKESDPFAVDIISAARCFIKNEEENESWNKWAKFFYYEMLVNDGRMKLDLVDTVTSVQGRYSYLDRIEQLIINKITDRDTEWQELYGKLYPNQKLYCELLTNKELTLNDINFDTLILFGKQLDKYVMENKISDLQKKSLLETFDKFIRNLNFQADFKNYESFVRLWLSERKGTYSEYLKYCGSNNVYSSFIEKDLKIEADYALSKCVSNIELILNINDGNGSRFLSPEEELNLRVYIYQYVKDDDNANKIASIINNTDLKSIPFSRELFFYEYENEKLFPKRDRRSLKDSAVIKSVLVRKYVDEPQSGIEEQLHKLGEEAISFRELELELLEAKLCSFDDSIEGDKEKWVIKKGRKYGYEVWRISKNITKDGENNTITKDLLIFDKRGVWDCEYNGNPYEDWLLEGNILPQPSPLSILDNKTMCLREEGKEKDPEEGVECILVLLSGVIIKEPNRFFQKINHDSFIVIKLQELIEKINDIEDLSIPFKDEKGYDIRSKYIDGYYGINDEHVYYTSDLYPMYRSIIYNQDCDDKEHVFNKYSPIKFIRNFVKEVNAKIAPRNITYNVEYKFHVKQANWFFLIKDKIEINNGKVKYELQDISCKPIRNPKEVKNYSYIEEKESCLKIGFNTIDFLHEIKVNYDKGIYENLKNINVEKLFYNNLETSRYFILSAFDLGNFMKESIKPYAEKTAKVAIMARNTSHNLGSHVMAYLKHNLSSVNDMIRNSVLDHIFDNKEDFNLLITNPEEWKNKKNLKDINDIALPFLVGLGKFISYIQERQDFIACTATDYSPTCSVLNFKDFIYDELNPDKRYKRHSDRKGLKPANILLGNIARSEGLGRIISDSTKKHEDASDKKQSVNSKQDNDIVIKFRDFDGEPIEKIGGFIPEEYYGTEEKCKEAKSGLDEMRKYNFSIPGGVTGRHAIFSILENLIRNAAKHGKREPNNSSLEFTFDIYEYNDIENRASENDNVAGELPLKEVLKKFYASADDGKFLYYVTLTDNIITDYETLKFIRRALIEPYIDDNGKPKDNYKGFKEIRICSAWLRSLDNEYNPIPKDKKGNYVEQHDAEWKQDKNKHHAPAIYVRLSNNHLQFIFCVRKLTNVLLISDKIVKKEVRDEKLIPYQWDVMTPTDFISGINGDDYYCILLEDEKYYDNIRCKSNSRLLRLKDIPELGDDFITNIYDITPDQLNKYFTLLLKKLSGYVAGEKIVIIDEKAERNYNANLEDILDVSVDADYGKYMFMTHYGSPAAFNSFKQDSKGEDVSYVEGITGSNSTDRLIRCETIDENWFYRQLRAIKTKVAIVDERLSNKIYDDISDEEFRDLSKDCVRQDCKDNVGALYADKNIWLFNIVKSFDEKKYVLYGWTQGDMDLCEYYGYCDRLAVIYKENNSYKIEKTDAGKQFFDNHTFDKISIHQGLMDKLYDIFKIKEDVGEKEKLTEELYLLFHNKEEDIIKINEKQHFLPGFSVHSGRSRPSEYDMPQRVPFIQYASLEHAVLDCKYTLTELLDSAYYESICDND